MFVSGKGKEIGRRERRKCKEFIINEVRNRMEFSTKNPFNLFIGNYSTWRNITADKTKGRQPLIRLYSYKAAAWSTLEQLGVAWSSLEQLGAAWSTLEQLGTAWLSPLYNRS
jgi:hypothetical protein